MRVSRKSRRSKGMATGGIHEETVLVLAGTNGALGSQSAEFVQCSTTIATTVTAFPMSPALYIPCKASIKSRVSDCKVSAVGVKGKRGRSCLKAVQSCSRSAAMWWWPSKLHENYTWVPSIDMHTVLRLLSYLLSPFIHSPTKFRPWLR
jgi:hypothetical protein